MGRALSWEEDEEREFPDEGCMGGKGQTGAHVMWVQLGRHSTTCTITGLSCCVWPCSASTMKQKRTSQAGLHAIHLQDFGGINTQRQQALCFGSGQKASKSTAASQVLMAAPSKGTARQPSTTGHQRPVFTILPCGDKRVLPSDITSSKISKFKVLHDVVHPAGQVPGTHLLIHLVP